MTTAKRKSKPAQRKVSEQTMTRPAFTLSEAEQVTGASRSTLRRRLAEGAFPNAYTVGKSKQWKVPVEDLQAAGLPVNAPAPVAASRIAELEKLLAVEQSRREAAEQLAAERAERVDDLRTALRMLDAGRSRSTSNRKAD